jgi:hypothetical protein
MPNAPVADVLKAAKGQGIKLSAGLVYAVRAAVKKAGGKTRAKGKPGRKPAVSTNTNIESAFLNAALDVGIERAEALLARVRRAAREA